MKKNDKTTMMDDGLSVQMRTKAILNMSMRLLDNIWKKELEPGLSIDNNGNKTKSNLALACILSEIGNVAKPITMRIQKPRRDGSIRKQNWHNKENENKPVPHNVVNWAYARSISKIHNSNNTGDGPGSMSSVTSAVLFSNKECEELLYLKTRVRDILELLDDEDVSNMESFYQEMLAYVEQVFDIGFGDTYRTRCSMQDLSERVGDETFYMEIDEHNNDEYELDSERSVVRAILIYAKGIVSSNHYDNKKIIADNVEYIRYIISDTAINIGHMTKGEFLKGWSNLSQANLNRFEQQWSVVEKYRNKNVRLFANAGFGKTLIGVMRILTSRKKTIWVAPTNAICQSNYQSVMSELNRLGLDKEIRVGTFYFGDYQEANDGDLTNEDYDILITNIDTILNYPIENIRVHLLRKLYTCEMIVDEYHELFSDAPLLNGFIRLLQSRLRYTNTATMLMSATPKQMDMFNIKDELLPYCGYLPIHNGDMKVKVHVHEDITSQEELGTSGDFFLFTNTVKQAQEYYRAMKERLGDNAEADITLIHANFIEKDKNEIFHKILKNHGKDSDPKERHGVVSTPIIGTAFDVSAKNIYDFVMSPDSTIQRGCGRGGRFGEPEYDNEVYYHVCLEKDQRNIRLIVDGICGTVIRNRWIEQLRELNNRTLTKSELYNIYNEFQEKKENKEEYRRKYLEFFNAGTDMVNSFRPKPVYKKTTEKQPEKFNGFGASWRGVNNKIWVVARYSKGGKWCTPINVRRETVANKDQENGNAYTSRESYMKKHWVDYSKAINMLRGRGVKGRHQFLTSNLIPFAFRSGRPLPLIGFRYDSEYGLYDATSN